jgi:Na+/H+ antiporter NhaD/arsenite permease-like protein
MYAKFVKLTLLLAGLALLATAYPAGAAEDPREYLVVSGSVVNVQNRGMNDAAITILADGQAVAGILTAVGGHYSFEVELPAGAIGKAKIELQVDRPGYVSQLLPLNNRIVASGETADGHPLYLVHNAIMLENDINASFWIASAVLVLIYIIIAAELMHRTLAAVLGGSVLLAISYTIGSFNPDYFVISFEAAMHAIDLNVIFLLMAMMIIVGVTKKTGLFQWMAYKSFQVAKGNVFVLSGILMLITAVVSAFLDNVTTMLLIIPVTLEIAKTLKINPVALLMSEVFASNVGGTATLIGDPPNILIGSYAKLSFADFAQNLTLVCLVCLAAAIAYYLWWYRKDLRKADVGEVEVTLARLKAEYRITNVKLLGQCLTMLAITIFLFVIHGMLHMEPSVAALLGAAILLAISRVSIVEMLEHEVEWPTLIFFVFLFIVVGAAENTGLIQVVAQWVKDMSQGDLVLAILLILWVSGIASALVDNIPFTATMLPIVAFLTESIPGAESGILWWALALGACLGGNGTMIGASANVVTVGLAEKNGYTITFLGYMKVAAIPTLLTLIISTLWIIFVDLP